MDDAYPDTWAAPVLAPQIQAVAPVCAPESRLRFSTAHLIMGPAQQASDFVDYVRAHQMGKHPDTGRWECVRASDGWVAAYQQWAAARGVVAVHKSIFLTHLGRVPGVVKPARKRLKDPATGNVIKLASGVPAREQYYIVHEAPPPVEARPQRVRRAA